MIVLSCREGFCDYHIGVAVVCNNDVLVSTAGNMIIAEPFTSRKDNHCLLVYDKLMQRIRNHKLTVDLQILDNEGSTEYKQVIKKEWNVNYQLVPPNSHWSNAAERAICTFKAHFLAILAGVAPYFPGNLWYLLLPQTELTLNLLRQSTFDP